MSKKKQKKSNYRLLKLAFVLVILAIIAAFLYGPNPFIVISRITSFLSSAKASF
jgi:hypothetical protein